MNSIKINQGRLLPLPFRFIFTLMVGAGSILIMENLSQSTAIPLAIILSLLIPLIWFASNILVINASSNTITQSVWLMGYLIGKPKPYNSIEKFYINKVKTGAAMYSQTNRKHIQKGIEYQAYMKLDNGEKYFLVSDKSEEGIENKLKHIKHKLGQ